MTSLTDQFLSKLRGSAPQKSGSPTLPTTSPTPSGKNSNAASSTEPATEETVSTLPDKIQTLTAAENVGIVLGMIAGWTASVLLCGLIITWVLGLIGLGSLTYWQVVGLLAIWELIKPTSSSK